MPTLLITGANRGIGLGFVRAYADDGWTVHALCRNLDRARDLKGIGGAVYVHRADVTDGLRIAGLARDLADEPVDVLINNAGIFGPVGGFGTTDFDDLRTVLEVNTLAPLRLAERFTTHVEASAFKRIVNISSGMASIARTHGDDYLAYRISKAALSMITKAVAADLEPRGIAVIAMDPGWVQTSMGGPAAPLPVADSVAAMRQVIGHLSLADTGKFIRYDGTTVPW
jgi:NAD(P)-dependent dehydrogenase (short-subunit alcohol dehydrogenase family)